MINHRSMGVLALLAIALPSSAQNTTRPPLNRIARTDTTARQGGPSATSCPGGTGIRISVTTGTGSDSASGLNTIIDERHSIDSTWTFNISQKSWTRTNLAAAISVGLVGQSHGSYAICAGVTALMPTATLTVKGARGRVHLSASLQDLINATRLGPSASQ